MRNLSRLAIASSIALLAACGGTETASNVSRLDNAIAQADMDPAVTRAIEGEIMVDPNLVQSSNANLVRTTEGPLQAEYPLNSGAAGGAQPGAAAPASQSGNASAPAAQGAAAQPSPRRAVPGPDGPMAGACGQPFQYGNEWAQRLPAAFPLYPGGNVTEAAGNNAGNCRMRVVSFTTNDGWQRVIEYYRGVATRAGFDAEQQVRGNDRVLGGVNGDGAYYLIVTPRENGSDVALIVNNGR